jgi:hypothetical protein
VDGGALAQLWNMFVFDQGHPWARGVTNLPPIGGAADTSSRALSPSWPR